MTATLVGRRAYTVSVRGEVPAEIASQVASAHAQAILAEAQKTTAGRAIPAVVRDLEAAGVDGDLAE
jgi:hypothetical protein